MMYGYGGWWPMMLMPIVWIVLVGVIVWAIATLSRRPGGDEPRAHRRETPTEILDRRLAAGDIDVETYTKFREVIEKPKGPGS